MWEFWKSSVETVTYRFLYNDSWYYNDPLFGVGFDHSKGFFRLGIKEGTRSIVTTWQVDTFASQLATIGGLATGLLGIVALSLFHF